MSVAYAPVPRKQLSADDLARKQAALKAVERELAVKKAHDDLIELARLLMPSPADPFDVSKSRYDAQAFHRALADALHEVENGTYQKLIICMPPRHGKSEIASKIFPAWFVGRDPYRHVMVGSYNQPFANDFGKKVRSIMKSAVFEKVFPTCTIKQGAAAVDRLETEQGGVLAFVGRGGSITGRGSDLFIIDDPLKNSKEADSQLIRDELWTWFNNDVLTRGMSDTAKIIIIQTRWHEDDLVGRLTDPTNPCFNEEEAKEWKIINIPAIAEEGDVLGRAVGEPLWPQRFGLKYLLGFKRRDGRGFMALYQQRPTPLDGDLFKSDMIVTYAKRDDIPKRLRIYSSSDHAVAEKQANDWTVIVVVGVDDQDNIWVLDLIRKRLASDKAVDEMLRVFRKWKPITHYAEREHIVKSIGPFLKKRMREEKVFVYVKDVTGHGMDKVAKAQSLIGRMSMRMVMFPKFMGWFDTVRTELLKFPRARHDDCVDALGLVVRHLERLQTAPVEKVEVKGPEPGTWGWFKKQNAQQQRGKTLRGM